MKEDDVGYGKPPKHTQFQKGRSGNPKGRRKGVANFKTDVLAILKAPVRMALKDGSKNISTQKAALLRLKQLALTSKDIKPIDRVLALAQTYNNDEPKADVTKLDDDKKEIVKAYLKRHFESDLSGAKDEDDEDGET